ncbi:MoaD/ThiS family protein [Oscillatoria amoena NRMC-F 0135]|nr:MoaD/ThiS family protein [Oscillatoria amoena NRMC-F 0135]
MKCTIKAFGISRDIIGTRELIMEFPEGHTVGDLKAGLMDSYPRLQNLNSLFVALNSEYAEDNQALREGDEIALIPPVSGG